MVRDEFRTKEYFDTFIEEDIVRLKEYIAFLSDERILKERVHLIKENIFELELGILIAKYSRGDAIESLLGDYIDLLEYWKEACSLEWMEFSYTETLWLVSLTVLLDMEDEILEIIKKKLEQENINDWLLNFILSKGKQDPAHIEGELLVPKESQALKEAICSSDKKKLIHYLEKEWYSNFKDYGWYDSHKKQKGDGISILVTGVLKQRQL